MFNRLSKIEYGYLLAISAKGRSEDDMSQVGSAAFDSNGIVLGTAYNGWVPGFQVPPELKLEQNRAKKSDLIIHAESNIFNFVKSDIHRLFLTLSPCGPCAKNIATKGIKEVYFIEQYYQAGKNIDLKYKEIFEFYGIKYFQATEEELKNVCLFMTNQAKSYEKSEFGPVDGDKVKPDQIGQESLKELEQLRGIKDLSHLIDTEEVNVMNRGRYGKKIVGCQCETCQPNPTWAEMLDLGLSQRFIICQICGNKRCPHATNHIYPCTNSNKIGQKGSSWEHVPTFEQIKVSESVKQNISDGLKYGTDAAIKK